MMTYKFDVTELDAETMCAARLPGEPEEEFLTRIAEAKGKHLFVVLIYKISSGSVKQRRIGSPYFGKDDNAKRWEMFQMALRMAGELVLQYEQDHPEPEEEEPVEKSRILLP